MIHSEQIDKIAPALVAAQRNMRAVNKTATNPHFKSKYVPLEEVMAAAREALHKQNIGIVQGTGDEDEAGFNLVTTLLHESGQWISDRIRMPLDKSTAQAAGSALTYAKRYGLSALLGIVADEDDDGNAATAAQVARPARAKAETEKPKKPLKERTEVELIELRVWATNTNKPDLVEKINDELERRRDADLSELPPELAGAK